MCRISINDWPSCSCSCLLATFWTQSAGDLCQHHSIHFISILLLHQLLRSQHRPYMGHAFMCKISCSLLTKKMFDSNYFFMFYLAKIHGGIDVMNSMLKVGTNAVSIAGYIKGSLGSKASCVGCRIRLLWFMWSVCVVKAQLGVLGKGFLFCVEMQSRIATWALFKQRISLIRCMANQSFWSTLSGGAVRTSGWHCEVVKYCDHEQWDYECDIEWDVVQYAHKHSVKT